MRSNSGLCIVFNIHFISKLTFYLQLVKYNIKAAELGRVATLNSCFLHLQNHLPTIIPETTLFTNSSKAVMAVESPSILRPDETS